MKIEKLIKKSVFELIFQEIYGGWLVTAVILLKVRDYYGTWYWKIVSCLGQPIPA